MPLDIASGGSCFIDANIFYYHFVNTPPFSEACSDFLDRVVAGDVVGHTSPHLLAEAVHKVMLAEASAKFGLPRAGLVGWLGSHRARIGELDQFREAAAMMAAMPLAVCTLNAIDLVSAADLSMQTGLLTNDALTIAVMRRVGVVELATNDDDFDGIPDILIRRPR